MSLPADMAIFIGGAFIGAFASGLGGFAFGLVASSVWLHVLPPTQVAPLILASALICQIFSVWRLRDAIRLDLLWPFIVGGALGIPLGAALLPHLPPGPFRVAVGLFLLLYSAFMLIRPPLPAVTAGGRLMDGAVGAAGGVLTTLAGLNGALPTVWCDLRGWPKDEQRGVYQPYIVATQVMGLAALGTAGVLDGEVAVRFALELPILVIGVVLGLRLYRTLDAARFRRILLWMLLMSGAALLL